MKNMRRKIIVLVIVLGVITVAGYNMYIALSGNQNLRNLTSINLSNIEALAQNESDKYSCTVTVECGFPLMGSISCTGNSCSRGLDWSSGAYVECDGRRTYC